MNILVTGGCGFIGAQVCEILLSSGHNVFIVDKLTYAANLKRSDELCLSFPESYHLTHADCKDWELIRTLLKAKEIQSVIHLAAESHVDRSISSPQTFLDANVLGTYGVLEGIRAYLNVAPKGFRFVHVSTDEVFGDTPIESEEVFHENSPYKPSSPYSASKAASDWLVKAWGRTFGIPWLITHGANTYGPRQLPDKLIPMCIVNTLNNKPMLINGDGKNIRSWIHVKDHAQGIVDVLFHGIVHNAYCIEDGVELSNIDIATIVASATSILGFVPTIEFTKDRPGNDLRYAMSSRKIRKHTGWRPVVNFCTGLHSTIHWYLSERNAEHGN